MDSTEDVSARVLLRHILTTETPRTPITRSTSKTQCTSEVRRSARLSKKDTGGQTPQDILRRSLKHKLHESISKKSPLPVKRRTTVFRNTHESALPSELFDEGDTPRHVLMNILRTEPVKSPVIHEKAASEEPQPPSANSSITSKHHSIELSGLELSDVTIGAAASIARGLGKKRPRRSLNVTAFEKRLQDGIDVENEESIDDHSSLSLSSSTSLSLKTPFVDVHTEKRGLQRRVPNGRKITEEEFGAKLQMEGLDRIAPVEWALSENTHLEGFTLGQTKLSEPDLTIDIINSDTANYAQTDGMTSNFSIVATQDKPTVMASQLQREMRDMEQEEQLEVEQSQLEREKSVHLFQTEEGSVAEPQDEECVSKSEKEVTEAQEEEEEEEEEKGTADCQPEDAVAMSESEDAAESQTSGRDDTAESEEEENRVESQTEEEGAADSQTEEGVAPSSHTEEEEDAEESQSDQQDRAENSLSEEEGGVADSQTEDENDGEQKDEHISRRAHHSEGGLIMAVAEGDLADATEAGWSEGKSKAHSASDLHSGLEMGGQESNQPLTGMSDLAESLTEGLDQNDVSQTEEEPDAEKENFPPLELTEDIIDSDRLSDAAPEEAAASDTAEQEEEEEEEEWEDEEDEESNEVPLKTPAFVKEKRNFFLSDPLASPTVFKNIQASDEGLPPANKKQVRQRKTGAAKRETALPKSYLMNVFKHFAKTKVSADVYPVLQQTMDTFFDRVADDLETYAVHAKRKTIEVEDAVLLLKRQGYVNDKVPVEVLIEKYLRMDQRKLLIPIATSGNVVIPKKRR